MPKQHRLTLTVLTLSIGCGGGIIDGASGSDDDLRQHRATPDMANASALGPLGLTFAAADGTIQAPFHLSNGVLDQDSTNIALDGSSGSATYSFAVPAGGLFVLNAKVNAPNQGANSLFINVDAQPADPANVWDIDVTSGFENRTVSWRGNGTPDVDQFSPKVFALNTGTHQLIVQGREGGTQVESFAFINQGDDMCKLAALGLLTVTQLAGCLGDMTTSTGSMDMGPAPSSDMARSVDMSPSPNGADMARSEAPDMSQPSGSTSNGPTYYVNSSAGSNSNSGISADSAWKTLTASVPKLKAGDTLVMTGTFREPLPCGGCAITFNVSGTSANPITFKGQNASIDVQSFSGDYGNYNFSGDYLVFDGLEITSSESTIDRGSALSFGGNHITFENAVIHDMAGNFTDGGADHLIVLMNWGNYNTYSHLTFNNINDGDLFRVWGHDNLITHNTITHCMNPHYDYGGVTQDHADLIQFWGFDSCNGASYNNVFENSLFLNNGISAGMLASYSTSNTACSNMNDWVYRNNVFANGAPLQVADDHMHLYNNLFYNFGVYIFTFAYGNQIFDNNVFIAEGSLQAAGYFQDPYGLPNGLSMTDNALNAAAQANTSGDMKNKYGATFITVTDPGFVDPANGDFHLKATSPLRGMGVNLYNDPYSSKSDLDGKPRPATGAWDIGPYQFVP